MRATSRESACRGGWTPGLMLTRDYLPWLAPVIGWLWTPFGSLALAAIAALLCGLVLHPRGFVVLFGLLTVLVLGVVWPWLSLRGLSGTLGFARSRVREGKAVTVRLVLRNRMPWRVWGLVVEGSGGGRAEPGAADVPAIGVACAGGCRTTETTWEFIPPCRGIYPARTPRIKTGFPFGIGEAGRALAVSSRLVAWPTTFAVAPIPAAAGRQDVAGLAPRNRPGPEGDFLGVRPYRRGDSLRRIHWPQTARHDQLVVCELQRPAIPAIDVVLDLHGDAHLGAGPDGSREWAIRVAASFLERALEQGAEVAVIFGGRVVAPRGGPLGARRAHVLDALAAIDDDEGMWILDDLLELPACRSAKLGLRIVVTTDRGLRRSLRNPPRGPRDRLVVLKAAAFAGPGDSREAEPPAPALAPACWIWIDDPERVPQCVRRTWKEVALGC